MMNIHILYCTYIDIWKKRKKQFIFFTENVKISFEKPFRPGFHVSKRSSNEETCFVYMISLQIRRPGNRLKQILHIFFAHMIKQMLHELCTLFIKVLNIFILCLKKHIKSRDMNLMKWCICSEKCFVIDTELLKY